MQEIIDRYYILDSPYLLPIIRPSHRIDERTQYIYASNKVNKSLKIIGSMLHLHHPLTLYVSRHSWASIARSLNVPLAVISEGMGHDSDKENWNPMLEKDSPVLPSSDELMVNSYKGIRL